MTPVTDRTSSLMDDVVAMLAEGLPSCGKLGNVFATISTEVDPTDPAKIMVTVQPIDFQREPIEIIASVRIVAAVVREPDPPAAIESAAHRQ